MCLFQAQRPITMKKENIQSRNRKLSAKARKKHTSLPFGHSDMMLKPLEKMYGYGAMAAAGMSSMAGMAAPYYGMHHNLTEAQFGSAAAAGMHHHPMGGTTFGPTSFGPMVRNSLDWFIRVLEKQNLVKPPAASKKYYRIDQKWLKSDQFTSSV